MVNSIGTGRSCADRNGRFWFAHRFARVQAAKKERALRAKYLSSELFAEPAWHILLELYSFELISVVVSESELASRISVPATTTAFWTKVLEAQGVIAREVDSDDARQVRVSLTKKGLEALDRYFSDVTDA